MKSRPMRVSERARRVISGYRTEECWAWCDALDEALDVAGHKQLGWALPSKTYRTKKEAREAALREAIDKGLSYEEAEEPVRVRAL